MWARINNGDRVAEITDIDPAGRFHPSIQWVECSPDTKPGWQFDGEQCLPPPAEPLADIAARQSNKAESDRDAAIDAGFTHTFGDTDDTVQTRERDRENLTGLAVSAQRHPDKTFHFRAKSNATYQLTADEILALADAAQTHVSEQYAKSWELKAQIGGALEAEDRDALEAVEWPEV